MEMIKWGLLMEFYTKICEKVNEQFNKVEILDVLSMTGLTIYEPLQQKIAFGPPLVLCQHQHCLHIVYIPFHCQSPTK